MRAQRQTRTVVLDATVVINLLGMGRLGLLAKFRESEFRVPNQVQGEVHRRMERLRLKKAVKAGWIEEFEITDMAEIELYAGYRSRFGPGESACMAAARGRGWIVASDDRAVKREVKETLGAERLLDTKGLLAAAVKADLMERADFDALCVRFGL